MVSKLNFSKINEGDTGFEMFLGHHLVKHKRT